MIPYWIVSVEWLERGNKESMHYVASCATYEAACGCRDGWIDVLHDAAKYRVEITGPFYRKGF